MPPQPKQLTFTRRCLAWGAYLLIRLFSCTWRVSVDQHTRVDGPGIYCCWHNKLLLPITKYPYLFSNKYLVTEMSGMVSASKDGAFLSFLLRKFKMNPIRGSSSRRGAQALVEARKTLKQNQSVAVTPDGPKGPVYSAKSGPVVLSRLCQLPIIPTSVSVSAYWELKSWDKFIIPKPFSRVVITFGKPFVVPPDATDQSDEQEAENLGRILMDMEN